MMYFLEYITIHEDTYAVFSDPFGGPNISLSREACLERLANLKERNEPTEETEKALARWPENTD